MFPKLELEIERLITEENVRYFYVGAYGGFDRVSAAAVKRAKQKYPDITLMLVLPYHPAERPTEAPTDFDGTYPPEGLENIPRRYAIVRTNKKICPIRSVSFERNNRISTGYVQKVEYIARLSV
ncbi:MAG: hypothetical protein IKT52_12335 [Oscillospiraceae bacterium]|nr:hypothetical protein [Oscillospiraceae bacterium]